MYHDIFSKHLCHMYCNILESIFFRTKKEKTDVVKYNPAEYNVISRSSIDI